MMHPYALGVMAVSWLTWTWDSYLDLRQYRVYLKTEKVPDILKDHYDTQTFDKSKAYGIDKSRTGFLSSLYSQLLTTMTLYLYLMPYFWKLSGVFMVSSLGFTASKTIEWEIFQSIVYTMVTSLIMTIVELPISIYNTFVIEQRHGFNKQTAAFYAWDKIKGFFLTLVISTPIMSAMIYIVRKGGPYFPFYLWLLTCVVVCLLMFFQGEIAAIFDKFTAFPECELKGRIEELAGSLKFPLVNIFVVEGSKRSSHSNAYLSGMFNRKRIVIYDTLIRGYDELRKTNDDDSQQKATKEDVDAERTKKDKGCNNDEIIAILAHELGHWYHSHLIKNLVFTEVNFFFMFLIFSKLYQNQTFFAAFGFTDEMPAVIGLYLLMMVLTPYSALMGFVSIAMSRYFEYQADDFSKSKGYAKYLKSGLIRLSTDNLGFPVHDALYSRFNHSHPTLIQRLQALDANTSKKSD